MNEPLAVREAPASYWVVPDAQRIRPGYKRTEVGVIPEDWDVKALGDCLIGRPDYGINAPATQFSDHLPAYIRITDITEDGRFSPENLVSVDSAESSNYFLADGDIVFARTGASVGKSYQYNLSDGALVFAGFLIRVRPDQKKILPAYIAAYVTTGSYWNWVRLMSMRSGQPGINGNEYAQLLVPIPPLFEQCAIATALSDVDALVASLDKLIAKKRDLKQAAMQQLLTGQRRLPGFGGEWEVKRLGELFTFSGGLSASRDQLSDTGYCYLHYGDIHKSSKTFIDVAAEFMDIPKLDVCLCDVTSSALLKDGDVVFVDASEDDEGTSRHWVVVNPEDHSYISGLHTIVAKSRDNSLSNGFKRYCFQTQNIKQQFRFFAAGTKVSGISKTNIAKLELKFPPLLEEQTAIATLISDMDSEIAALEARRDKTRAIKQGMMQALLTGRIRLV